MHKAAQAYFSTQVSTTDQGQLLLMLYDGALNFLAQAREKILARDVAGKGVLISRVIDIVNELASSLNMEKGGSLAENLNNLYFLCTARLLKVNAKLDVELLDSVVHILSGLRSAYAQIVNTPEAKAAAAQISARQNPRDALMTGRAQPLAQNAAPSAGMGRLQAQAAYNTFNADFAAPAVDAPPHSALAEKAASPASAPVAPVAPAVPAGMPAAAFGRKLAAYGRADAGG